MKLLDSGEVLDVDDVDEQPVVKPKRKEKGANKETEDTTEKAKGRRKGKRKPLPATYEPGKHIKLNIETKS